MVVSRFKLRAYVCEAGCVRWQDDYGWSTFSQIYIRRPDDCRYAVAEKGAIMPEFIVWDLFNVMMTPAGELIVPPPMLENWSLEAAVMATQLTYSGACDGK